MSPSSRRSKQQLRHWLRDLVDSGRCPGVCWVNKAKAIFQIPWLNQKSRDWNENDSRIFLEYAIFTGKYEPGQEKNYPRFKQNLKSAIDKNKGRIKRLDKPASKTYRFYMFVNKKALNSCQQETEEIVAGPSTQEETDMLVAGPSTQQETEELVAGLSTQQETEELVAGLSTQQETEELVAGLSTQRETEELIAGPSTQEETDMLVAGLSTQQETEELVAGISTQQETEELVAGISTQQETEELVAGISTQQETEELVAGISTQQETEELVAGPSTQEETDITMVEAASDRPDVFVPSSESSSPDFDATFFAELDLSLDWDFFDATFFAELDLSLDCDFLLGEDVAVNDNENNRLSNQESTSLHDLRNGPTKTSSSEEQHVNPTVKKQNFPSLGQQEHMDFSNILRFVQSIDSIIDTVAADPVFVSNQLPIQDHGPSISNEAERATDKFPDTKMSQVVTAVKGTEAKENAQVFCIPQLGKRRKMECLFPGKVSKTRADEKSQLSSSSLTDVREQSSNESSCRVDIFGGRISLGRSESSQLNSVTSSCHPESIVSIPGDTTSSQDSNLMQIQVIYGTPSRVVKRELIRANTCRIFYGKTENKRIQQVIDNKDKDAVQIELPSVESLEYNDDCKKKIRKVLDVMELGVVITYRDGNIYVVRRCKPRVYLSDGVSASKQLQRSKITKKDEEILAFDFNGSFIKSVENHKEKRDPIDRSHFLLTFGYEILPSDASPTRCLPVFIVVDHVTAISMRKQELGPSISDPVCSLSDSFGTLMNLSKLL